MTTIPPLFGDSDGKYRIRIVGNSGVGKSTLGRQLSKILGIPYFGLDELYWKPGWEESSAEEFEGKINKVLSEHSSWIMDGNFVSPGGNLARAAATDIVWLDPPFVLYFYRLLVRTSLRLLGFVPGCSPGCTETIRSLFAEESIISWCYNNHQPLRDREHQNLLRSGVDIGGNMRRIGGWGSDLTNWLEAVRQQEQTRLQLERVE
ncbi:hypothetical protein BDN72DRAFT_847586 [Pluteus cervinus]|uniref:Uncharacterized protein n=1 Tax=Pluteus cervinus TaxID=181527 RepID=A0ACD3ADI7_9AGAR|nr:hypothetical protein BDN72DRAFT_847586 [Pluteus cervinus]